MIFHALAKNSNLDTLSIPHPYMMLKHDITSPRSHVIAYTIDRISDRRNLATELLAKDLHMIVPPEGIYGDAMMFQASGTMTLDEFDDLIHTLYDQHREQNKLSNFMSRF